MAAAAGVSVRPSVTFEVEKIIDVSVGTGNVNNYQVQWAPTWVSGLNLQGCEHLIEEFLHQQDQRLKQIQRQQKQLQEQQQKEQLQKHQQQYTRKKVVKLPTDGLMGNDGSPRNSKDVKRIKPCSKFHSAGMRRTELKSGRNRFNEENLLENRKEIISNTNVWDGDVTPVNENTNEEMGDVNNLEDDTFDTMKSEIDILDDNLAAPSLSEVNCVDTELPTSDLMDDHEQSSSSLDNSLLEPDKMIVKSEEVLTVVEDDSDEEEDTDPLISDSFENYPTMTCSNPSNPKLASPTPHHSHDGQFYNSPSTRFYDNDNYIENIPHTNEYPGFQISEFHSNCGMSSGEEKAYKCEICGKSYSTKNNLNRHQRLHTDPKPYTCGVCDKTFSRNDNMLKHQRLYAFACTQCKTHFTTQESLDQHMSTSHDVVITTHDDVT